MDLTNRTPEDILTNLYSDNKGNFEKTLSDVRTQLFGYDNKNILLGKTEFSSLDEITESLNDGRFSVEIQGALFECLFFNSKRGNRLYVTYNGARGLALTNYVPGFTRWSYHRFLGGSYLGIDDPEYFSGKEISLSWFYGTKERCYIVDSLKIVEAICNAKNIPIENITFLGSSGGGYVALYAATIWKKSLSISINPQIYLKNWSYSKSLEKLLGVDLRGKDPFNRNDIPTQIQEYADSHHVLVVNAHSKSDWTKQIIPFAKDLGINLRYGLNRYKNILIWIYDAQGVPSAHNSSETRSIFLGIESIAMAFQKGWGEGIPDSMQSLSVLINENWHDYYKEKVKTDKIEETIYKKGSSCYRNIKFIYHKKAVQIRNIAYQTGRVVLKPKSNRWNFFKYNNFLPFTEYKIEICQPISTTGVSQFTVGIYDFKQRKVIKFTEYPLLDTVVVSFSLGADIDGLALCVYAGIAGKTRNHSLSIENIVVYSRRGPVSRLHHLLHKAETMLGWKQPAS